ncbi:CRISPR-associated protein Cas4 [uncultured Ilyobacter sp.]|uniref:CRISPR-associated protein Cas4 n=1 Tax=uncultured Ilyobacter sp. TaxID=544433 RepID=UPI002AA85FC3|nr:CRISPR-associated protein Cas4 [uncultured Ilyobacter sp.]
MEIVASITPSLMLEYLYCPRFIYFMKVLHIKQNEETRFKVQKGREIHQHRALTNKDYFRAKIGVVKKEIEQELYSNTYSLHGKIDEILFLDDGSAAPLDYKFAEYKDRIFSTYKTQLIMYSLMIRDNYSIPVDRAYIVYTRSKNKLIEITISKNDYNKVKNHISNILQIINLNFFPKGTRAKNKCIDCCYKNICVQ